MRPGTPWGISSIPWPLPLMERVRIVVERKLTQLPRVHITVFMDKQPIGHQSIYVGAVIALHLHRNRDGDLYDLLHAALLTRGSGGTGPAVGVAKFSR